MADPRKKSNRLGIAPRVATYQIDGADIVYDATQANGSAVAGRAVRESGNGVVRLTGAAETVLGKLLQVEPDGFCSVQTGGYMDLPKGDGTLTVGAKLVGDVRTAARGYVRGVAVATLAEVAVANGRAEDVSVADACECLFG